MQVYYQIRGIPTTELSKRFDGNTTFEGVITGLAGFTDYEIRLLAFTKVGGTFKGSAVVVKTREGSKYHFIFFINSLVSTLYRLQICKCQSKCQIHYINFCKLIV